MSSRLDCAPGERLSRVSSEDRQKIYGRSLTVRAKSAFVIVPPFVNGVNLLQGRKMERYRASSSDQFI
jgi:hypothetical protein